MTKKSYLAKNGRTQFKPVLEDESELHDRNLGFCLACGTEAEGVEPDARKFHCAACGEFKVYGLEELLMMGLLELPLEVA